MHLLRTIVLLSLLPVLAPAAAAQLKMGSYGRGCGGGTKPPQTCVMIDGSGMTVFMHQAAANRAAFLALGLGRASVPMGGACHMLVLPQIVVPTFTNAQGRVEWRLPSPFQPDPRWRGLEFCFQHAVADVQQGEPLGYAMTNGFSIAFR